jgi:hypothetical protein
MRIPVVLADNPRLMRPGILGKVRVCVQCTRADICQYAVWTHVANEVGGLESTYVLKTVLARTALRVACTDWRSPRYAHFLSLQR